MENNLKNLALQGVQAAVYSTALTLPPDVIASLVLNGDLSRLTDTQRVAYYNNLCERVGLDPATQPFKLLKLNGKIVLYADKGAAQQLSQIHGISHDVVGREKDDDIYTVTIRASIGTRFTVEDGSVAIGGLKGEALANAKMKAMTKGKRRAVLALMGLGMTDEIEVDSIEGVEQIVLPKIITDQKIDPTKEVKQPAKALPLETNAERDARIKAEAAAASIGMQDESQPTVSWFEAAKGALDACCKKGLKENAREWGESAYKRMRGGEIAPAQYTELKDIYLAAFPPAPAPHAELFDKGGNPTVKSVPTHDPAAAGIVFEPPVTVMQKERSETSLPTKIEIPKKKAGKPAVGYIALGQQIAEASKLSVLFTIKGRIERAELSDGERENLFRELDAKLTTLKGAKA